VFANEAGHVCPLPFDQADTRPLAHCTIHPKWSVVKHDFDNMWAVYAPYDINPTAERFTWAEALRLAQEKAK
jgi:hypothetical protein